MIKNKPAIRDGSIELEQILEPLIEEGIEGLSECVASMLNAAMKLERSGVLRARPYERSEERRGYANGYKSKQVKTRVGELSLSVPKTREVEFYPSCLEKGLRSERALVACMAQMYLTGISTRKVRSVLEKLCGLEVTSMEVSRATQTLDDEFEKWRSRSLGQVKYLILDARYEKAREESTVEDVAVLIAIGVLPDGRRRILGVGISESEAEIHWRQFLESLLTRGMTGVEMIVSDDHSGLRAARRSVLPSVPWQRCQFHLLKNANSYIRSEAKQKETSKELRDIFDAPSQPQAKERLGALVKKHSKDLPRFTHWAEENILEGLTVFQLPEAHRKRMRTSNSLERLNREVKRRTRVVSIFPNREAALRLVTGVLIEFDEQWSAGKKYLTI